MAEAQLLQPIVLFTLAIFLIGLSLRFIKQPFVIIYIVAGIILGSDGLGIVKSSTDIAQFAELGVIILLFFIGMHVSLPKLISNWRITVVGTLLQIALTVFIIGALGIVFEWNIERSVLIGFVIALSSTAVIIKMLQDRGEIDTKVGQNVIGILLVQDFAIIPMIIILEFLGGESTSIFDVLLPMIGGLSIIAILALLVQRDIKFSLPLSKRIRKDHEIQVFLSLVMCFGFAFLTSLIGISAAIGAFLAGIFMTTIKETEWVSENLKSFEVVFVALFFVYIGTLIDIQFIIKEWFALISLLVAVLLLNTALSAIVLRSLGDTWRESIYAGALLAQVGEFSFLLGTIGFSRGFIVESTYLFIISLISMSLLFSPLWILITKRAMGIDSKYVFQLARRIPRTGRR